MNHEELWNHVHSNIDFNGPVLFYIKLDDTFHNDYFFEFCMRFLPLTDQKRILDKKSAKDRQLKLLNALILRFVISLYSRQPSLEAPKLSFGKFGKPKLDNIGFNISDEDDIVSIVIDFKSSQELGLDLANVKDIRRFNANGDFLASFKDIFSSNELGYLQNLESSDREEQNTMFTYYWALKESYSKFIGTGLSESFAEFDFEEKVRNVKYIEANQSETYPGFIYKHDDVQWRHYHLDSKSHNHITMITPNIVCSVFTTKTATPQLVEIRLEGLIRYLNSI